MLAQSRTYQSGSGASAWRPPLLLEPYEYIFSDFLPLWLRPAFGLRIFLLGFRKKERERERERHTHTHRARETERQRSEEAGERERGTREEREEEREGGREGGREGRSEKGRGGIEFFVFAASCLEA